jgi:hypothetical protein
VAGDAQNVHVTQVNKGCGSGCGTVFAVLFVVGLIAYVVELIGTYWYVAIPLAVLALAGGIYWWDRQRSKLPAAQAGPEDPWLDQVASRLRGLGFVEQTRNTGHHLLGVPLDGDICLDADGLRVFVNLFSDARLAAQAEAKLRTGENVATGSAALSRRDRVVLVASGLGVPVQHERVEAVLSALSSPPSFAPVTEPAQLSAPPHQANQDVLDQLRKLGELRDAGVISVQEFEAKKVELLGRL